MHIYVPMILSVVRFNSILLGRLVAMTTQPKQSEELIPPTFRLPITEHSPGRVQPHRIARFGRDSKRVSMKTSPVQAIRSLELSASHYIIVP